VTGGQQQLFETGCTLAECSLEQRLAGVHSVLDQEPDLDVEARWELLYTALYPSFASGVE
jgi:hypothetical protein